jgi:hypothetical protein
MKIIKGLWYLCHKSHSYFIKNMWHYSPMDGYLNGSDNKPHPVEPSCRKIFTDGEEWRFNVPK